MSVPNFYPAIKYDFRPDSYWGPAASPLEAALRNVKGRNRRQMIIDYNSRGLLPALSEDLLRDTLDEDTRRSLDRIHPSFMGGEYLAAFTVGDQLLWGAAEPLRRMLRILLDRSD